MDTCRTQVLFVSTLLVVVLMACSSSIPLEEEQGTSDIDRPATTLTVLAEDQLSGATFWRLVSMDGFATDNGIGEGSLDFLDDGRVLVNDGCMTFSVTYSTLGTGQIRTDAQDSGDVNDVECLEPHHLFDMFRGAVTIDVDLKSGNELHLKAGSLEASFDAATAPTPTTVGSSQGGPPTTEPSG